MNIGFKIEQKIFSLQFNFLRTSINDMHYEETDPNFLPLNTKKQHHNTYKKFIRTQTPTELNIC